MRPQHRYDDDDSPFDRFGVLKDGHTATVSMMMRDSSQRDARVTDALHRPGFRTGDADMRDAKQQAYDAYETEVTNAWRGDDARKKKLQARDPQGREAGTLEEEDEDVTDARPPVRDSRTLDQVRHDHQVKMAAIYDLHDEEQRNAWRKP
jgi:hypothetical protein